jgi:hypothetical protein
MNISEALQQLISLAKTDALKAALPALATFLSNIAANPSGLNIAAQLAKLQIDLITALPGIEQDLLKQIATIIQTEAQALLSKAPA